MTNDDIAPLPLFSACLPDLRKAYRVGDALEITNRAVHPQADDSTASDDEDLVSSVARDATWCKHMSTLEGAALVGEVQLLNPLDYMPHMLPMGAWLLNALIPRDELQRFARTKLRIELTMPAVAETALAPAAEKPVPVMPATSSARHSLKPRADPLAAVLAEAKRQALDPTDWQSVWAALVKLAESVSRPAPLQGYVEGEGAQYRADDAAKPVNYLSRDAFRKRFGRS